MLSQGVDIVKRRTTTHDRFKFVPERSSDHGESARKLEHAIVHSHAARIAHSRREPEFKAAGTQTVQGDLLANSVLTSPQYQTTDSPPSPTNPRTLRRRSCGVGSQHATRRANRQSSSSEAGENSVTTRVWIRNEGFLGLRIDPFKSIKSGMDDKAAFLIDWYNQNLSPSNDVICYVFDVTNCYAHFLETLADDAFFYAGLGVIGFMLQQLRHPGSAPSPEILTYRGMAITKVRERLAAPSIDVVESLTVYSIIFLCLLDGTMGNLDAHRMHKRSLAAIVASKGGLERIPDGSLLKSCLLQFDTSWTLETGESVAPQRKPAASPARHSPCPTRLATLPRLLLELYWASGLSTSGFESLRRAYELTTLSARERGALISSTRMSPRKYNDFRGANTCLDPSNDTSSELGVLLSLTLAVYCYTAFGLRSCPTMLRVARAQLSKRIPSYGPKSKLEEDAIIWMWLLVVNAWAVDDALQPTGESLLTELQSRHPKALSLSYAIELNKEFLWTPELTNAVGRFWRPRDVCTLG